MTTIKNDVLAAIGDSGKPVDWWFIYKVAKKSKVSDGSKAQGTEYIYFDNKNKKGSLLSLSNQLISDAKNGCVGLTLDQVYSNLKNKDLGWFFYNDEDPVTGKTNDERGHTKGVLAFNVKNNTAFWLIHSSPKFPPKGKYSYPATAIGNAQSFLCITLKDVDTAKAIAAQMYQAQQPNVYLASALPAGFKSTDKGLGSLLSDIVQKTPTPYANFITFSSKGGQSFKCIAKNKHWDKIGDDDFYNDLVGTALAESLEVETWEHYKEPGTTDDDHKHTVRAMKSVNLQPLKIKPSYVWSEENDHAKIAISAANEKTKYVCVGDLNFTTAQEERSGGTVAFIQNDLWKSLDLILSTTIVK